MRVLVCGGRDYADVFQLNQMLDITKQAHGTIEICHGGAKGADTLAGEWAKRNSVPYVVYPANWDKHGRSAGPIRNKQMLDEFKPGLVIAFPGGAGTKNMIGQTMKAGVFLIKVPQRIFVFGSNLAGRHGKGAALEARQNWGAIYGQGVGLQGRSYGIPTKSIELNTLGLNAIKVYVDAFLKFAALNTDMEFIVTKIGCGLAGYTEADIAPMFKGAPDNCLLPEGWR